MLSAEISARLGDPQNSDFNTKTAEVWMMFEIFSGPMTYFFGNPQIGPSSPSTSLLRRLIRLVRQQGQLQG